MVREELITSNSQITAPHSQPTFAIIVAGGSGTRMGGGIPKQFRNLCGRPVLWWSMKAFHDENPLTQLVLVLPETFIDLWKDFYTSLPEEERFPHKITAGGTSRTESVSNGIALIDNDNSLVAVHDGARPLVKPSIIRMGWETANLTGAAIPVVPVTDSLRKISQEQGKSDKSICKDNLAGIESKSVDRNKFMAVQTPQVFKTSLLKEAYEKAGEGVFTDDASVVEHSGHKISLFEGSPDNIKITGPKDMAIAAILMGKNV